MSQIIVHNGTVYLAGQMGEDMSAGVEQQTRETLTVIERLLEEVGIDRARIFSVIIYLKSIDTGPEGVSRAWDQWPPRGVAPVRVTVEAKSCESEILVGMSVVAVLL